MNKQNNSYSIIPGKLSLVFLKQVLDQDDISFSLHNKSYKNIEESVETVNDLIRKGHIIYGANTGFGKLANTLINKSDLVKLQHNLIASHCTGVGEIVDDNVVRLIAILKINSLARGYSGIRLEVLNLLLKFINRGYYPCIPCKGSVGASGDLAPLAHLSAPLIGLGYVRKNGNILSGMDALKALGEKPLLLGPLEGLSLLNGTQVSTAFTLKAFFDTEQLFAAAIVTGAMSTEALKGSIVPFRDEIHALRGLEGQAKVAKILQKLLANSQRSRTQTKVQDPYSLRCQPQVMGACYDQLKEVASVLSKEINAVTNNPIVLIETQEIVSGGNFHAQPIAFCADKLAMVISEIASLTERRIALLIDPNISQLPAFLINDSGLNSGFMIAQVTAAALVSENKSLCYPCSVDSIPTSANQEDHVSMATHAARRLFTMTDNTAHVLAIELLSAAQGFDFFRPQQSTQELEHHYSQIRSSVAFYECDRFMADDINAAGCYIKNNNFEQIKRHFALYQVSNSQNTNHRSLPIELLQSA